MEESVLIQLCLKQDYTAQEFLYKKYAPRFLALILRYIPRRDDAEDVLVESIFKICAGCYAYDWIIAPFFNKK